MKVTLETVDDRSARSECCNARISIVLKQIRTSGTKVVWQCNACEDMHVLGNKEQL